MEAEAILVELGHSVEVIYHHTLKPFDSAAVVGSARKTRKIITFEEISRQDGLFNLVNSAIAGKFEYSIKQIAINDFVRPYGTYQDLCNHAGLSTQNLLETALNLL